MHSRISLLLTAALFGGALAACSSGSNTSTTTTTAASPATAKKAPAKMSSAKTAMASKNGAVVFSTNCSSCHGANGSGGIAPPLAGNMVVTGDPKKVIHIVKNGLTGSITVNGKTFNGQMPAWKTSLSNGDIAAVITYIRSSWGNHASAVTTAEVASTP